MKNLIPFLLLFLIGKYSIGQIGIFSSSLESQFGFTSNEPIPFWLRNNQFGSIPSHGTGVGLIAVAEKSFAYDFDPTRWKLDWSTGTQIRGNVGQSSDFEVVEAYAKIRYGFLQMNIGRTKEYSGLVDSSLSSGSFSLSGNALGIPKVELAIPEYTDLPYTNGLFSVKGNMSFGWIGDTPIHYGENRGEEVETYYHHLSVYGQLGKRDWKLKLEAAVNHDVIWGSDRVIFGDQYKLSFGQEIWHVLTGKDVKKPMEWEGSFDISKVGNHLGSIDVALNYELNNYVLRGYRQFFYDKGALRYLGNIKDGLTGFSLSKKHHGKGLYLNKIVAEIFYSKDQAGQEGAPWTPSGPEYYYNHGVYSDGFSYKGQGMGNPFIMPAYLAKEGQANDPKDYFISNRTVAYYLGAMIGYNDLWTGTVKVSHSRNYGDYHTSGPDQQWFNGKRINQNFSNGLFKPVNQFSAYAEGTRVLNNRFSIGFILAADYGGLLYNSFAGLGKIKYRFN